MRQIILCISLYPFFSVFFLHVGWCSSLPADSISNAAKLLSEYVQIASVTGNEKSAGEFLAQQSKEAGLHVHVFTHETDSYNFAASLYPLSSLKPNIIFLNHIDVVPSGEDSLWTFPPFSGKIHDGYVWGRGALDNKAMGVMHLLALADFVALAKAHDLPWNFTMLSVSNEELGGEKGASLVTEKYLDVLNPVAVYGEGGTGLAGLVLANPELVIFGIEVSIKRALWLRISASSPQAGHGSVPFPHYPAKQVAMASINVLTERQPIILTPPAKAMLREIGRHEKGLRKIALRNIGFFRHFIGKTLRADPFTNALLTNTITLTNLGSTNGAYNQISHSAWATFDCRLLPGTDAGLFVKHIRKHMRGNLDSLEVVGYTPESGISPQGDFYLAMEQAILTVYEDVVITPILFPAHNDNAFFRAKGIPAYGIMPSLLTRDEIDSVHNIDERISLKALSEGLTVYKSLINLLIDQSRDAQ